MIDLRHDGPGIAEQSTPGIGQFDAARLATEQLHVEFPLQRADLLAERRLLHPEPFRRPRTWPSSATAMK